MSDADLWSQPQSVTLRNRSGRAVRLQGFVLRDAAGHRIRLGSGAIKARGSLVVVTGCQRRGVPVSHRRSRYYACRRTELWDDAGDVVELVDVGGGLRSRQRYGASQGRTARPMPRRG